MHDIAHRFNRIDVAGRHVAAFVFRLDAAQRSPRSNIVPSKVTRENSDPSAPLEHADVLQYDGPFKPCAIETCPAARFAMMPGIAYGLIYLGLALIILPIIIIYALFSRYIVSGIAMGAIKE